MVPPGLVTFSRNRAGLSVGDAGQFAGAGHGGAGEPQRKLGRQPFAFAGLRQRLDQQKDIGRAAAGNGGYRVEQRLVLDPGALADGGKQRVAQLPLGRRSPMGRRRRR